MLSPVQLAPGDKAPDVTLIDHAGRPFKLSEQRGQKVILYFFPAALTPGCTREANEFDERLGDFAAAGYRVFGVSPDTHEKLARFHEREQLGFDLLSDHDLAAHHAFGAVGEKSLFGRLYRGVLRSTVLIDGNGLIEKAFYRVKLTGHAELIRQEVAGQAGQA